MSQSTNCCLRTTKWAVLRAHAPSRAPVVEEVPTRSARTMVLHWRHGDLGWSNPRHPPTVDLRIRQAPGASSKSTFFVTCTCVLRHKLTALQVGTCDHLQNAGQIPDTCGVNEIHRGPRRFRNGCFHLLLSCTPVHVWF